MIKLNGEVIKPTIFPDKTSQVWKLSMELTSVAEIEWIFENEAEIMHLAQLKYLLDQVNINCGLYMPYLPYARQDKLPHNNNTFALRPFANIINSLNFKRVYALDIHNLESQELFNNFRNIEPREELCAIIARDNPEVLCYPDAGAKNRYSSFIKFPFVYGNKERNQETGAIDRIALNGNVLDKRILIVDDICDGGATFTRMSKLLLEAGAKAVSLYVTHGIFSKGVEILKANGISRVYTYTGEVI